MGVSGRRLIADLANIYVLGPTLSPLFKIPLSNVTSLALGGGYVVAGRISEAVALSLWDPADRAITQARSAIDVAVARGANVTEAQSILNAALSYRKTGAWFQTYSSALKSVTSAEQAPMPRPSISTTSTSSSSTIPSVQVETLSTRILVPAALVVVALAAIVLVFFIRKKRPTAA